MRACHCRWSVTNLSQSLPDRVAKACQVAGSMSSLMNRTDVSSISALTPPEWRLRGTPAVGGVEQRGRSGDAGCDTVEFRRVRRPVVVIECRPELTVGPGESTGVGVIPEGGQTAGFLGQRDAFGECICEPWIGFCSRGQSRRVPAQDAFRHRDGVTQSVLDPLHRGMRVDVEHAVGLQRGSPVAPGSRARCVVCGAEGRVDWPCDVAGAKKLGDQPPDRISVRGRT